MKRDPRIDPRTGDVVAKDGERFTVAFMAEDGDVYVQIDDSHRALLTARKDWITAMKNGRVIHAAE